MDTSKLLERCDFRQLELDADLLDVHFDAAVVDRDLQELAERFQTIEGARDGIRTGDIVIINLPAEGEQEAETIHVNVGKHYYGEAWENALLGRTAGEQVVMAPIDGGREGTIRAYFRKIITAPTDQMVQRMEIPEADTLDSYRRYLEEDHIRHEVNKRSRIAAENILQAVAEASTFGDLTAEIEAEVAHRLNWVREQAEKRGTTYEEELKGMVPPEYDTPEKAVAYFGEIEAINLKLLLLSQSVAEEDRMPFNRENYEKKLARRMAGGQSREEAEASYSFDYHFQEASYNYFLEKVRGYVLPQIKVIRT